MDNEKDTEYDKMLIAAEKAHSHGINTAEGLLCDKRDDNHTGVVNIHEDKIESHSECHSDLGDIMHKHDYNRHKRGNEQVMQRK